MSKNNDLLENSGSGLHGRHFIQITDSNGNPNVFYIKRNSDGKRYLNGNWANPKNQWNLDNEIVFPLRKCPVFLAISQSYFARFCFS